MFYVANLAMTGHEGESAVMLFVVFIQLLKLCGAIHNLDHVFAFVLRRMENLLLMTF